MKKIILALICIFLLCGCSIVRIDTSNIDNIINVILSKDNKLYNQVGQGYKYYLPGGVTYIESDNLNDILYCNGVYYYLNIDVIDYYYNKSVDYKEKNNLYYSKLIDKKDGYKYSGYLEIELVDSKYRVEFSYNHAKIEAVVDKNELNNVILNSSYILSTIKYNPNIIKLMLDGDYFKNKTGKYNDYNSKTNEEKFKLEKEVTMKER